MSKTFPGIRVSMGSWNYTTIRIRFSDLGETFVFQRYLDEENKDSLDVVGNREVNQGRATKDMGKYLARKKDRFYSTVVVANLVENNENWQDIDESTTPEGIDPEENRLGYLTLNDNDKHYILDGQHRVASILNVLAGEVEGIGDSNNEEYSTPEGFGDEQMTVHVINREPGISKAEMIESYRRLFTSLNRNAKPTDPATNIALDEDDVFALMTRHVIKYFEPFSSRGAEAVDNPNIQFSPKNINASVAANLGTEIFTSLETLYKMTITMMNSPKFPDLNPASQDDFKFRPNDNDLEDYNEEILKIWEAIFDVLPEFHEDRKNMRKHNAPLDSEENTDHALLWPATQEGILAPMVRFLLDQAGTGTELSYSEILKPLSKIPKDFRKAPWNPLILVPESPDDPDSPLRILARGRDKVLKEAMLPLLKYLIGAQEMDNDDLEELKGNFEGKTRVSFPNSDLFDEYWEEILALKD